LWYFAAPLGACGVSATLKTSVDAASVSGGRETNVSMHALIMTKDPGMSPELDAVEFSSLSREQRIAKCRDMAAEAERLAARNSGDLRDCYVGLAEKWSELADEMEQLDGE